MNIEILNIAVTSLASVKMLLILVGIPEKMIINSKTSKEVNEIMDTIKFGKNNEEIREMIIWTKEDGFADDTLNNKQNEKYLVKLRELQSQFLKFYLEYLNQLDQNDFQRCCDIHTQVGKYVLQIMRLRMVIEPEIQISINIHTLTKIEYLAAKSFWINDKGEKVRKYTKSIGRMDEFKLGRKDPQVHKEALLKIQDSIYSTYLENYPE